MTWRVWHSKATGEIATRGGLTTTLGAGLSEARSNSDSSGGRGAEQADICLPSACGTTLTTNCPVPPSAVGLAFRRVSFSRPSSCRAGQNSRVIGLLPTPAKKEKGARLVWPAGEIVETKAMGRGRMAPMRSL
ncbi:MAG: hypothetical protein LW822_00070 [Phycisphaeraceae bacterium]|nr:hypothetical protein [Phycisphaeraceae bacterium]